VSKNSTYENVAKSLAHAKNMIQSF